MPAPALPQSHLRYPLTSLLGSPGQVRALRVLCTHAEPQSASQVAALTHLTPQGTRLVLEHLSQHHIVKTLGAGRSRLYALNKSHPLSPSLVALFENEQSRWNGILESIRDALDQHGSAIEAAWLYGSVVRGEDAKDSDLDIAVVVNGLGAADALRLSLMPLEAEQHLAISITALTPKELLAVPENDLWWSQVVQEGRVLKGSAPTQTRQRIFSGQTLGQP